MSPLQLIAALSGLALTAVLGQTQLDFADPPPLPAKGTFLSVNMHEQSYTPAFFGVSLPWYQLHAYNFLHGYPTLLTSHTIH